MAVGLEDLRLARHRPIYYLALDVGTLREQATLVLLELPGAT